MFKELVETGRDRRVFLMDSISSVTDDDVDAIVVSASHGGQSSGEFACRVALRAVFFNDAGVGKDGAGIRALTMLQARDVIGCTVDNDTACIGDAQDHWNNGVVSHVNDAAGRAGLVAGMKVRDAVNAVLDRD